MTNSAPGCDYYPQTGHSVCGAIRDHYNAIGGAGVYGYPTTDEGTSGDGQGKFNFFQNNAAIYWSPNTPASEIGGAIFTDWGTHGYETGFMGYPITDELVNAGNTGSHNNFQNNTNVIYWSASTGAHQVGGAILTGWANQLYEVGRLSYPTSDERGAATEFNGGGDRQNDFANGSIYFNHANGVIEVQNYPQLLTGPQSYYTQNTTALTDRISASVNLGTGNLELTVKGLTAPGVNGDTSVGLTYNSLLQGQGSPYQSSSLGAATSWRSATAPDLKVVSGFNYADVLTGSGAVWSFHGGPNVYVPSAGLNASLTRNGNGTWTLSMHDSSMTSTYDTNGILTSITDRNGNSTVYTPTTVTGTRGSGDGIVVRETYNGPGGKLSQICQSTTAASCTATATRSATTLVQSYVYDAQGNLASVMDPAGKTTSFVYDTGNADLGMRQTLTSMTDPNGVITRFGYDTTHRVTSVTRNYGSGGTNAQTVYDMIAADGHTRVFDPNHTRSSNVFSDYLHAPTGPITAATDPKNHGTSTTWTANNQVASGTNALTGQTQNTYTQPQGAPAGPNGPESLTQSIAAMGSKTSATYANTGAASMFAPDTGVDASGNTSQFAYNSTGNLTGNKNAMAATALVTYNPDGTTATSTDPNNAPLGVATAGASTTYGYTNHQLTTITAPTTGNSMAPRTLTYDGFGRVATVTTGLVATTTGYDQDGRTLSQAHTNGVATFTATFDPDGNGLTSTDAAGTVTNTFTKSNQLASAARTGTSASSVSYSYDAAGNLATLVDGRGTTTYHYDVAEELDQVTESSGKIDILGYNNAHQVVDTYDNTSGANGGGVSYDFVGNLQPPAGFAVHQQSLIDNGGRLQETVAYRASSNTAGNRVMDLSYCYTAKTPNQGCPAAPQNGDTAKRQYQTDNLTGAVTTYNYDPAGRLKSAITTGGPTPSTQAYCDDPSGNRVWEGNTTPDCVAQVGPGKAIAPTHTYNTVNQLTSDNAAYDVNGNQTAPAPLASGSYNPLDQFTNGGANVYGGATNNEQLTVATSTTLANGVTGVLSTKTGTAAATYFERTPGGGLISERGAGGEFYYVTDGNGSTVALVDTTGTVQATYAYDTQGATTAIGGPNSAIAGGNPYRYAGGYTDTTTGLIKFGARTYNPTLGNWTQLDSLTSLLDFANGNRYAYAGDDPINNSDASGHCILGHVDENDDNSACRGSNVDNDLDNVSKGAGAAATVADVSEVGAPVGLVLGGIGVAASGAKTANDCFGDASEDTCKGDAGSLTVGAATLGTAGAAAKFGQDGVGIASDLGNNVNDVAGTEGAYGGG